MSIMTNQMIDVPQLEEGGHGYWDYGCGHVPEPATVPSKASKRRFFQSSARWDNALHRVIVSHDIAAKVSIAELMENGGRAGDHDISDPEEEMDIDEEEGES